MRKYSTRQREIIEATIRLIYEAGYHSLTVKKIANRLGITDAALYKHFISKDDMISGAIDYFDRESEEAMSTIMNGNNEPFDKVRDFFLDRCRMFKRKPEMTIFMLNDEFLSHELYAGKISIVVKKHRKQLIDCLRRSQNKGHIVNHDPEHLFLMIMGSLRLVVRMWQSQGMPFDLVKKGMEVWITLNRIMEIQ